MRSAGSSRVGAHQIRKKNISGLFPLTCYYLLKKYIQSFEWSHYNRICLFINFVVDFDSFESFINILKTIKGLSFTFDAIVVVSLI